METIEQEPAGGVDPAELERQRQLAAAYSARHIDVLRSVFDVIRSRPPMAGSDVVRMASPITLAVGPGRLSVHTGQHVGLDALSFHRESESAWLLVSVRHGTSNDLVAQRMMSPLVVALRMLEELAEDYSKLRRLGFTHQHPSVQAIMFEVTELMTGINPLMVGAAFGRPLDDDELKAVPVEPTSTLH
jgi:hypothetical protein